MKQFVLVLVLALSVPLAWAQQRFALVVGNSAYKDAPLLNPVNDARAVAEALRASGFQVALRENLDQRGLQQAVREFGDRLRTGGVGLFYFAGHGMQIKGRNYLIPVGATIEREDEVAYAALDAQAILDKMESAGNVANIMVLDACRNNPFARSFRSRAQGLAQMDAPAGTLVAFATAPGSVASDGDGRNGLYTQNLLAHLREPGLKVEDVFKRTRADVRRLSDGRQVPWESTSLEGDIYFVAPKPALPAALPQAELESAMWDMVKNSRQPVELRAYLARFPAGRFAAEARARVASLEPASPSPSATMAPRPAATAPAPAVPAPAVAAATGPATAGPVIDDTFEAEIDRRTQEILAELAKGAPGLVASMNSQNATKALQMAARPPAATNPVGFRTGDRWRYQLVNRFLGEVVDNYQMRVDGILPNGDMLWNGNAIVTSPQGNFRQDQNRNWPVRTYVDADVQVPDQLREGHRQAVAFTNNATRANGLSFAEKYTGTLTVKKQETVKVPAGEFLAWRVERDLDFSAEQSNGARWFGRNRMVGWYVPELRNFVLREFEHRVGTGTPDLYRHELTSYEVSGAREKMRP